MIFFFDFAQKIDFDILCKLSPFGDNLHEMSKSIFLRKTRKIKQMDISCNVSPVKCQRLYSWKKVSKMTTAKLLPIMSRVKEVLIFRESTVSHF